MGWIPLNSIMIISGAFGLFSKKAVLEVGGYNQKTVGEDMDLILNIRKHNINKNNSINITFIPDAVCWTQCPNDLKSLGNQRKRWQKGLFESLWEYKSLFLHPKGKLVSFFAFPFFVFIEAFGPIVEIIGYTSFIVFWLLGYLDGEVLIYFFLFAVVLGFILSISSLLIEELFFNYYKPKDILKLLFACVLDNIWFRYIHLYWRILGTIKYFKKDHSWGEMKRKKF